MAKTEDALGHVEPSGDGWELRFVRHLGHPVDKVWRAITEPEHLKAWFPQRIVGTLGPGARLKFEDSNPGVGGFDGEVLAYEPPHLLELRWGTDVLRFEIAETASGCDLTLTDKISELGKASRDGAGWHVCLDALVGEVEESPGC